MKLRVVVALAALTGGQFVQAAGVPVVERTASETPRAAEAAPAAPRPAAAPTPAPQPVAVRANPAAEMLLLLDQLQEEVRFLRGRVEEQENLLRRMREDQRDRYRDLDRRITLLSEQAESPVLNPPPSGQTPLLSATGAAPVIAGAAAAAPTLSDTDAYKAAFALVRQRSFNDALGAFEQFLRDYPASSLVPNVLYWSGEVHRAKPQPDPAAAQQAYAALVQRYPQHPKSGDAYYKLGLTYAELGDKEKAKQMMQVVLERYADQASARLARDYLAGN